MSTVAAIRGVAPIDALEILARELDALRVSLASPSDAVELIDLAQIREEYGLAPGALHRAIQAAGQPIIKVGRRKLIRKSAWMAVLCSMEESL